MSSVRPESLDRSKTGHNNDNLCGGHLDGSGVDVVDDVVWGTSIDGATDALRGSQDLLDGSGQLTGHAAGTHRLGNGHDIIVGNVAAVLDCKGRGSRGLAEGLSVLE